MGGMAHDGMSPRDVARQTVQAIDAAVKEISTYIDAAHWGSVQVREYLQGILEETESSRVSLLAVKAGAAVFPKLGLDPTKGIGRWENLGVSICHDDDKIELVFGVKPKKDTGISNLGH